MELKEVFPHSQNVSRIFSILARCCMVVIVVLIGYWGKEFLGGYAFSPADDGKGGNDTSGIFNFHPLLMGLAFPVLMAEAILTYQAPMISCARDTRKKVHAALHFLAIICMILGFVAAYKSHTLKRPAPIPNFYSPHSYLGLATIILALLQFLVGLGCYLNPKTPQSVRAALSPVHKFSGRATFVMGLAAMAAGFQEKTTFVQQGKGLAGDALFGQIIVIPGVILVMLLLLGLAVFYHQVPESAPPSSVYAEQGGYFDKPPGALQGTSDAATVVMP